ncbi:reverse transcriptase domain-containing protein [Tanacetum coccineum]
MNQKADVLSKLASVSFNRLTKEVLVEVLNEQSKKCREVHIIVEEEGDNWMTPIIRCLEEKAWGMDILGPLSLARGGAKFIIMAIDYFTNWIEAKPCASKGYVTTSKGHIREGQGKDKTSSSRKQVTSSDQRSITGTYKNVTIPGFTEPCSIYCIITHTILRPLGSILTFTPEIGTGITPKAKLTCLSFLFTDTQGTFSSRAGTSLILSSTRFYLNIHLQMVMNLKD